jgi:hydroxylamine oxidation protein HaoB
MTVIWRRSLQSRLTPAILMIAGGLIAATAFWSARATSELPYRRTEQAVSREDIANGLGMPIDPAISIRRVSYLLPDQAQPLATSLALSGPSGNVSLTWENHVAERVLSGDATLDETSRLLKAIHSHVADDDVVFAWWDLSRKIRLITRKDAPLDDRHGRGLLVPEAWEQSREAVKREEARFWKEDVADRAEQDFSSFFDSLLKSETDGANDLEQLARGRRAFVVVRLSDLWRLASDRPDLLSIAYRDFPGSAQSHGVMKQVREWLRESGLDYPYAVEPIGSAVRIHYLPKAEQQNLLIAKLLPFTTTNPLGLSRFRLVFQHRGYWIYRLVPAAEASAS